MRWRLTIIFLAAAGISRGQEPSAKPLAEGWDHAAPMKKVAGKFRGNEGVVIHVGGSMTSDAGGNSGAEPTAENLRKSGYQLRGWLTVQKIAEVKRRVLD